MFEVLRKELLRGKHGARDQDRTEASKHAQRMRLVMINTWSNRMFLGGHMSIHHTAWYLEINVTGARVLVWSMAQGAFAGGDGCILAFGGPAMMHVSEAMHTYTVPIPGQ